MNIDWSKAPEGYPIWLEDIRPHREGSDRSGWAREGKGEYNYPGGGFWSFSTRGVQYIAHKKPEWNGKGLTPVGAVCELKGRVLLAGEYDSKWFDEGDQVEVGGHAFFTGAEGSVCTVCVVGQNYTGTVIHECLRPICTPEQIAAEDLYDRVLTALRDDDKIREPGRIAKLVVAAIGDVKAAQ